MTGNATLHWWVPVCRVRARGPNGEPISATLEEPMSGSYDPADLKAARRAYGATETKTSSAWSRRA